MSKVKNWEYNDVMHDYLKWQNELERLLKDEEPDEVSIQEAREIIAKYEDALFSENYDDEEDVRENISDYFESHLKDFELEGVEISEDDIEWVVDKMKSGMSMEDACDECLQGIYDCLDTGLDYFEEIE